MPVVNNENFEDNSVNGENRRLLLLLEADMLWMILIIIGCAALGISIFTFTKMGKYFGLFCLFIALVFNIILVINYLSERKQVLCAGLKPRNLFEVIAIVMSLFAIFLIWLIYEVMHTETTHHLISNAEKTIAHSTVAQMRD